MCRSFSDRFFVKRNAEKIIFLLAVLTASLVTVMGLWHVEAAGRMELQQHLAVKPSTVNGIVDRLVEKGMLTRAPGETDARCRILRLTACGQQFYDDFVSITHEIETLVQRGMTPQEVDTLRRLLLRAAENLTSEEDNA